ncbi:uncharacterized protein LACBIDRAFT_308293 [Laccaria bicolor S238N-H82]|uniref:Predicted protein n=1 Tax=Laccaria bicolor (strain S238N-H82 / ATCC MYA-4686) TaxID=486041 RepID=B0DS10_LACBS|nr:uncharacterized protein LACBIDRAFT_308293 [Laccaria bicolor S238N-H82]EDR02705.1 predicted protein [Laccaria bicolor S238N-H82]|eukprot:XP_001886749.1 predicted protein [Laccaria bicolor S238N-H82]
MHMTIIQSPSSVILDPRESLSLSLMCLDASHVQISILWLFGHVQRLQKVLVTC